MESDNDYIQGSDFAADGFALDDFAMDDVTLESILAEYKGTAYINGDKKTPTELLNEQTERIIKEALGGSEPYALSDAVNAVIAENTLPDAIDESMLWEKKFDDLPQDVLLNELLDDLPVQMPMEPFGFEQASAVAFEAQIPVHMPSPLVSEAASDQDDVVEKDSVFLFFENYQGTESEPKDSMIKEVEMAIEREIGYEEVLPVSEQLSFGIMERSRFDDEAVESDFADEEVYEPDLKDALKRFLDRLNSVSYRFMPAMLISIIMVILTFAGEAEMILPFGIGRSHEIATGTLMIMLLLVMLLCVDLVVRGASDLLRCAPNAETLILFSCAFSLISGAFTMIGGSNSILPYSAVSAVSLTIAAFGERLNLRAITETIKTAIISSEPYGIQAEYNADIDRSVLKKAFNRTDGFYSNLMHPDVSETAYRYAAPMLLAAALILSIVKVAVKGGGEYFLHTLSALLAAAAPFSALLAYSVPFCIVTKSGRGSGSAVAGWGGVDDICNTDGASVTDDDLFPPGTMSFNGVKLYENVDPEKVIRYTASLIMASESGLSRLFAEVLKTQKMDLVSVDDFACYEGGIGARISNELVVVGSAAFMNLLSIRIPDDVNMKNAVFTAINNRLVAMFAVEYLPVNSVQGALISMLKWRIKLFFAMRDFNITPLMLERKFKVSLEDIEYIQVKDSYSISDPNSGSRGRMAALLSREGLAPFAEAITGGRLLKSAAVVATTVSVVSAALGVLFMFYMFWNGSMISARPGNLFLFMLCTLAAVLVVCGYVKCKK